MLVTDESNVLVVINSFTCYFITTKRKTCTTIRLLHLMRSLGEMLVDQQQRSIDFFMNTVLWIPSIGSTTHPIGLLRGSLEVSICIEIQYLGLSISSSMRGILVLLHRSTTPLVQIQSFGLSIGQTGLPMYDTLFN